MLPTNVVTVTHEKLLELIVRQEGPASEDESGHCVTYNCPNCERIHSHTSNQAHYQQQHSLAAQVKKGAASS